MGGRGVLIDITNGEGKSAQGFRGASTGSDVALLRTEGKEVQRDARDVRRSIDVRIGSVRRGCDLAMFGATRGAGRQGNEGEARKLAQAQRSVSKKA